MNGSSEDKDFGLVVRPFGSCCRRFTSTCIYAWERDFPKEIVVYFILVFSYSKIVKLLGSNKSNYGSDYREGLCGLACVGGWADGRTGGHVTALC